MLDICQLQTSLRYTFRIKKKANQISDQQGAAG